MQSDARHRLPAVLARLLGRRSALLLQKLVLFEGEAADCLPVRHYDYDCEGIQILAGFLRKKQQAVLLKAFSALRAARPPCLPTTTDRKPCNRTTRRTHLNSTFSEATPLRSNGLATIHSHEDDPLKDSRLHTLLSRVRAVNVGSASETERRRTESALIFNREGGTNRESAAYCLADSRLISHLGNLSCREHEGGYFRSHQTQRSSRRQLILQQFARIESGLRELQVGEGAAGAAGVAEVEGVREEVALLRGRLSTRAIRRSAQA